MSLHQKHLLLPSFFTLMNQQNPVLFLYVNSTIDEYDLGSFSESRKDPQMAEFERSYIIESNRRTISMSQITQKSFPQRMKDARVCLRRVYTHNPVCTMLS